LSYSDVEQEIIVLNAVWDHIDDMANYEIFAKTEKTTDVWLYPNTAGHARLFNILLLDFLTSPNARSFDLHEPAEGAPEIDRSYLYYLHRICAVPKFGPAADLQGPVDAMREWLCAECVVKDVWFPSIEVKTDIKMPRLSFVKICGNISKHNFASLSRDSKLIAKILAENGVNIDDEQRFLVIPDFYDWFHRNIFSYHIGTIAEHLNNIRWGMFDYLNEEWMKSYRRDANDPIRYSYTYPADCTHALPRWMYWDLMNRVRGRPWMPRFSITDSLKKLY
jgi:hypothetical protein